MEKYLNVDVLSTNFIKNMQLKMYNLQYIKIYSK